jgi:hypothetical protein
MAREYQVRGDLSDDILRHAVEPFTNRFNESVAAFVIHGPGDTASVVHTLTDLWLSSYLEESSDVLRRAYTRATLVTTSHAWGPEPNPEREPVTAIVLALLARDAPRLPAAAVLGWLDSICANARLQRSHIPHLRTCLEKVEPQTDTEQRIHTRLVDLSERE